MNKTSLIIALAITTAWLVPSSQTFASDPAGVSSPAPTITQLNPSSGSIGSTVNVVGTGFLFPGVKINFDSGSVDTNVIDNNNLSFIVPSNVTGGCTAPLVCPNFLKPIVSGNSYNITVSNNNGISNSVAFSVTGTPSFLTFPNGTLLQISGSLTVYQVQNGVLRPFTSSAVFFARGLSWSDVQNVNSNQINPANISTTPVMLPDGSVAKGSSSTEFIIYSGKKYGIPSVDVFNRLGLSFSNVVLMSDNDLQYYSDGGIQY